MALRPGETGSTGLSGPHIPISRFDEPCHLHGRTLRQTRPLVPGSQKPEVTPALIKAYQQLKAGHFLAETISKRLILESGLMVAIKV